MSTAKSFDATFDYERIFRINFFAEICQEIGFFNLCRLFQKFLSGCIYNKSELGLVMSTGWPGEPVESISGYARS